MTIIGLAFNQLANVRHICLRLIYSVVYKNRIRLMITMVAIITAYSLACRSSFQHIITRKCKGYVKSEKMHTIMPKNASYNKLNIAIDLAEITC